MRRPGCGPSARLAVGAAQEPEHPPQLAERLAPRARDRDEGLACPLGIALEHRLARLGLHHHRADAMRDDVVQLARQPRALVGDRGALARRLLAGKRVEQEVLTAHDPPRAPRRRRSAPTANAASPSARREAQRERCDESPTTALRRSEYAATEYEATSSASPPTARPAVWSRAPAALPRRRRPAPSPAATAGGTRAAMSSPAPSGRGRPCCPRSARWRRSHPATRSRPARAVRARPRGRDRPRRRACANQRPTHVRT